MKTRTRLAISIAAIAIVAAGAFYFWRGSVETSGSTIRLRLPSFALNLDPLKMADVDSRAVATLLYAGLVFQDQKGDVRPVLATSWTHSGSDWEFVLRPGITFSDGTPLTVADVVASLCAAMQPSSPWAWSLASIDHTASPNGKIECTGITAPSADRVRISEKKSVPWLLDAISGPAGWIMPAENRTSGPYGVRPGAGPYKIREIVPDVKVVLERRTTGSPLQAGAEQVQFDYLPDDMVAATRFQSRTLDVLDLITPQLIDSLIDKASGQLKTRDKLVRLPWDRIRVAIINEKALGTKGLDAKQIRKFIDTFSASIDRSKIAELSRGIGEPISVPMMPLPANAVTAPVASQNTDFPSIRLTIVTEPDAYSDLVAASLPKKVGNISINYKGLEKGILINSMIKGEYDIAVVPIEATVHSPEFWKSFFTRGSPLAVFGKEIPGLEDVDVSTSNGAIEAARLIIAQGNWVPIIRERRVEAIANRVDGVDYSPSGQTNYSFIRGE